MTERDIQFAMYDYRRGIAAFPLMVPNVYLWAWESDLIYVSQHHYATEFEVKTTHSDFLADSSKIEKHRKLNGEKQWRPSYMQHNGGPKEFYYCCPEGVISESELPEYAGLFYVTARKYQADWRLSEYSARFIKSAKRRPVKPLTDTQLRRLLIKGVRRYWSMHEAAKLRQEVLPL